MKSKRESEREKGRNTTGARVGSGFRNRKKQKKRPTISFLNIKKRKKYFLIYISASYAKIWEETKFQPWEFLRSGSKAIDLMKETREKGKSQ